ncbi:MAG: L,D-transpeptidase [Pyrinomonadaceae bacterium]
MKIRWRNSITVVALLLAANVSVAYAQTNNQYHKHESARSDKFTGGRIEKAAFEAGQGDLKITVNIPAFRLTLWQNNKEVKTYQIGVGQKEFPLVVGDREATSVIWNPAWIPPDSDWVADHKGVSPGEVIKASDKRNPLGKMKIPLGGGYLIHQAAKPTDLGNLVSHGCVRMLRSDLYDLAEKIVAARELPVSEKQIETAKRTFKTVSAPLDPTLPVEIDYDTQVIEGGVLHIYPDVYGRGTNTTENLRAELETSGVNASQISEGTLEKMLARTNAKEEFVVDVKSIEAGRALTDGHAQPLVGRATTKKPPVKNRATSSTRGRRTA